MNVAREAFGATMVERSPTQKIRQRTNCDCGAACLAMVTSATYHEALDSFRSQGLDIARGRKPALTSNFAELMGAARYAGLTCATKRFDSWATLRTPAIVKVNTRRNGRWHWVFVVRDPQGGVVVMDPAATWRRTRSGLLAPTAAAS